MNTMSADQIHIINQFLSQFIVPNFYRKEHFYEMTEWSDEKVERFKKYLTDKMCADDRGIKDIVRGYIETFEEEPIDIDEEQEDDEEESEQDVICKNCDLRFYDILLTNKEKHGDWCHCSEKCYDEMEQEDNESDEKEPINIVYQLDSDEETCDRCGKKESECDIYEQGDNITNFATTGEMLCPDCIPETNLEQEDDEEQIIEE